MKLWKLITALGTAAVLAGCTGDDDAAQQAASPPVAGSQTAVQRPAVDSATLAQGKKVFDANCAACHGSQGQGAPNWQKPGPDGKYPAPPLNGTGHAWHHPMAALQQTIRNGTQRIGGSMPPWKDTLSEEEIQAVIYWFQSHWPDELYAAWQEADARSRKGAAN